MAKYVFTYHGGAGMAEDPEEIARVMEAWGAWFATMGDAVVDGGNPVGATKTVAADGSVTDGSGAEVGGYSIISADSIDDAVAHAKGCPVLEVGGRVEVHEAIDM